MTAQPKSSPVPPVVVLVETQMGENIGAAARAMANFGLRELRLVKPRDGWPNEKAIATASRGIDIIDAVQVFETLEDAIRDLQLVFATTARSQDLAKPVTSPAIAGPRMRVASEAGQKVGIVFGRERTGLTSDEVGLADEILTIPVDPAFASLNVGQAVIIVAYEWRKAVLADDAWTPYAERERSPQAVKDDVLHFFGHLERLLDEANFFRPAEKRPSMVRNLRQIFLKARLSEQEVKSLRGVLSVLEGRATRTTPRRIAKLKPDAEKDGL